MPPSPTDRSYLADMRTYAVRLSGFLNGQTFGDFEPGSQLRMAVERGLEIIDEAANRTSASLRAEHPEIPWLDIIGQRNFIAHQYGDVLAHRIWHTATIRVPQLIAAIDAIIPPDEGE